MASGTSGTAAALKVCAAPTSRARAGFSSETSMPMTFALSARDHHRRKTDSAASINRDPFTGSQPRLRHDAAIRRRKAAAERRRFDEFHLVGKADQIDVGEWQGDIFGERAGA